MALFHIAQEALSNAAKHSRASRVDVRLEQSADSIVLSISDNGQGFDAARVEQRLGHSLVNMRDCAQGLGGSFSLRPVASGGTEVIAALPVPKAASRSR